MSSLSEMPRYHSLHAPTGQGEALIDPAWPAPLDAYAHNRSLLEQFAKQSPEIVALRQQLLRLAVEYSRSYRDVCPLVPDTSALVGEGGTARAGPDVLSPIIMTGHQSEFFHPGVLFKNFLLDHMARLIGATAVHLIIDNDLCRNAELLYPELRPVGIRRATELDTRRGGESDDVIGRFEANWGTLAIDAPSKPLPHECRFVRDERLLASLGERVAAVRDAHLPVSMVERTWPSFWERLLRPKQLGYRVARYRHLMEQQWGLMTLEVPLSQVCETDAFRLFVARLAVDSATVRHDYNEGLALYRQVNKLRSRTHPATDLETIDGWLELPFWVWHRDAPDRRRLFVRPQGGRLRWSCDAGSQEIHVGGSPPVGDPLRVVQSLRAMSASGWAVRPRALMTTLFARLFLCDLFIHGIGGAKYDAMTDWLIRRWYPHLSDVPQFVVATATVHLPWPAGWKRSMVTIDQLRGQLRELQQHPDRVLRRMLADGDLPPVAQAEVMAALQQKTAALQALSVDRKTGHRLIAEANERLREYLVSHEERLRSALEQQRCRQRTEQILFSREVPFCFFPGDFLAGMLKRCLPE